MSAIAKGLNLGLYLGDVHKECSFGSILPLKGGHHEGQGGMNEHIASLACIEFRLWQKKKMSRPQGKWPSSQQLQNGHMS